ncbi:type III-B CRISPR module-associated Cmr3 family protein [Anditalea andensis]|uniref:CRISPR-associated protein Cmr3 n=1 Tax=Anditalea andensis TaxID=1048983 RepID=A0A074L3Y3_9BACT|nr:type III-B CRISPR module-associated Cmr3 family protein [Anditalea andensis]KEO75914.1 hypothetical protein EL17_20160 [Anditalea andensis]
MNSISYRIELEPLGDFFFGGENTFGEGDGKNYFAKSNRFPQQSALLGMLRFELLKKKKLLPISQANMEKVKNFIGEKSFDFDRNSNKFEFGIIESISPVFLTNYNEDFIPAPFDYKYKDSIKWHDHNRVYLAGNTKSRKLEIRSFDIKEHNNESQYKGTKHHIPHPESKFFKTNVKIGVNTIKSRNGNDDKEAFFKQEFISLNNSLRFVFYAQLKEDIFGNSSDLLISLGGEQSMFRMKVKKAENTYEKECRGLFDIRNKIVLISDTYVSSEQKNVLDNVADFAWSDTVMFRSIKTSIKEMTDYANKPNKSEKIHLIKRGSVFYYSSDSNKDQIVQILKNKNLQRCGFNIYLD